MARRLVLTLCLLLLPGLALAQSVNIDLGTAGQAGATSRLVQITVLITVLTLAPSLLVMTTAFTRIVIVLSYHSCATRCRLRGLHQTPC